jgi:23S rRNA-/tRNA-specific pseudouridylate synthase
MLKPLYRDGHWLALDKPSGLVTTPPTTRGARTLLDVARELAPKASHHHALSRLDAEVSGVVLFALTQEAVDHAVCARAEGSYARRYVGLTSPAPADERGAWTWPVAIDRRDRTRRTTGDGDEARDAETRFTRLATAGTLGFVVFVPVTGRTHQIRVHAKAAGVSLVGDLAYGGARRVTLDDGAVVSAQRAMLHAWRVRVPGAKRIIEAPLPEDLRAVWTQCGGGDDPLSRWIEPTE